MCQLFQQVFDGKDVDQIDEPFTFEQIRHQYKNTNQRKKIQKNFKQDRQKKYQYDE